MTDRPLHRDHPRTEYEHVPAYYESGDIPHVLARVRLILRLFNDIIEEDPVARTRYDALFSATLELLQEDLSVYALDLALSLIALEDHHDAR